MRELTPQSEAYPAFSAVQIRAMQGRLPTDEKSIRACMCCEQTGTDAAERSISRFFCRSDASYARKASDWRAKAYEPVCVASRREL